MTLKLVVAFFAIVVNASTSAAQGTSSVIGIWKVERFVCLELNEDDPDELMRESKGIELFFQTDSSFVTSKKIGNKKVIISTGNFRLSRDNKYLYQDGKKSEILVLTENELALKVKPDLVLHFRKTVPRPR